MEKRIDWPLIGFLFNLFILACVIIATTIKILFF
jgi:hypothetical protein